MKKTETKKASCSCYPRITKTRDRLRLTVVWDEREELFGIGDKSDKEDGQEESSNLSKVQAPHIVISHS